jgi:DNA gyrase inhibitor GyrI
VTAKTDKRVKAESVHAIFRKWEKDSRMEFEKHMILNFALNLLY